MTLNNKFRQFGLIGYPLSHSFSKKYFAQKFEREGIENCHYELYPISTIEALPDLVQKTPNLVGFNITIPYKQSIFNYLDEINEAADAVGAVNTVRIQDGKLIGYNTDVYGFEKSLVRFLNTGLEEKNVSSIKALILGTGGAAKAVSYVLKKLNIEFKYVSRKSKEGAIIYKELDKFLIEEHSLIINTTPLGMSPNLEFAPDIPYKFLSKHHFLYDLVYNPEKTLFLAQGEFKNARTYNGLNMLYLQAEKAWEIWNK